MTPTTLPKQIRGGERSRPIVFTAESVRAIPGSKTNFQANEVWA